MRYNANINLPFVEKQWNAFYEVPNPPEEGDRLSRKMNILKYLMKGSK